VGFCFLTFVISHRNTFPKIDVDLEDIVRRWDCKSGRS